VTYLESLASTALKTAEKKGASQAEAFVIGTHSRSVYVENSKPRVADDKIEIGLGLKVCLGKRVGSSSGTVNMNKMSVMDEIVNEALSIAKTTEEDPNFRSMPTSTKISGRLEGVYSEETCKIGLEEIVAKAMDTVKAAEKTKNVKVPLGLIRLADYSMHVANSLGINFSHKGTMVFSYFKSKAAVGDNAGEGIEKEWSTNISKLDFEGMGNSIAEKALATMNAESFNGESPVTALIVPVELFTSGYAEGLMTVVEFATNAEQVNKRRSPWINKLGAQVTSEKLTVWDDGRYSGGIRSALADDEGVETSKKTIIDKGKLQSYIYDSYNANIAGAKATGNGFRRGTRSIEGAFAFPTVCDYANMVVKPGNKSLDGIISQIDKGVLVETFAAPEVNPITGGFACEVRNATLIDGGKLTKHVKHALLTGNMYEALKNVFDIGEEAKMIENTLMPPIAFSNVTLVGQK
jgi:PmbA protein